MTYDKDKLAEKEELMESIGYRIWTYEKKYAGEYEIVEQRRQDFIEALNLILYTTSGVFDEREIIDIDISPESDECSIEITIDILEVHSDNTKKLSKAICKATSFSIVPTEGCDEDDAFLTLTIRMKNMWKKV